MAHYRMVAMSDPVAGSEAEFERWYQQVHLPELMTLEGFVGAQRYRLRVPLGTGQCWSHMVIYEIETADIERVIGKLVTVAEAGGLHMSEAMDRSNAYAGVYEPCDTAVT